MINLVLLLPVLIVLYNAIVPKEAMTDFTLHVMDLLTGETTLPELTLPYGLIALVFFACWLPLAPARHIITAYFATARLRRLADKQESGNPGPQEQLPPLYQDMPVQGGRKPR